jgi:predicted Fe-Mo cluster-binding NifX family protein
MNLAISIAGESLDSPFDPRFGRAPAFCLVDLDTGAWQVLSNPGVSASGGAGVQAAQFIAQHDAHLVASGAFGPKAFEALAAAGIQMLVPPGKEGLTAADILSLYQGSGLRAVTAPSHEGHHGSHP